MEETSPKLMDVSVPSVYILSRTITDEELEAASRVLSITPCPIGICTKVSDHDLLAPLTQDLLLAASDHEALIEGKKLSQQSGLPVLVAGEGSPLTAVYSDGRTESLCTTTLQK